MTKPTSIKPVETTTKGIVITEDANDRVQIPETFEDSDAESESSSERIRRIDGYGDIGQGCSKSNDGGETQQFWCMEKIAEPETMNQVMQDRMLKKTVDPESKEANTDSQAIGVEEENCVVNTQESTVTVVEASQDDNLIKDVEIQNLKVSKAKSSQSVEDQQERRRSERLRKVILLTTQDRNEIMAKKRCLKGNSSISVALSGINNFKMCSIAKQMGVVIEEEDFDTFEELELARADLYDKQQCNKQKTQVIELDDSDSNDDNAKSGKNLRIEWHHEDSSELEDFLLSISDKKNCRKGKNFF